MFNNGHQHGDEERAFRKRQEQRFPDHTCELPAQPNRVYPLLPPDASMWMRLRSVLQKQVVGWRKCRALRLLRPSTFTLEAEQAKQAHSRTWWVLHPYSRVFVLWQLVVIIAVFAYQLIWPFYYCFLVPYAFMRDKTGDPITVDILFLSPNDKRRIEFQEGLNKWKNHMKPYVQVYEALYAVHMATLFFTGYYDRVNNQVVMQPSLIIRRYLTTWFFFDLSTFINSATHMHQIVFSKMRIEHNWFHWYSNIWIWIVEVFLDTKLIRIHYLFEYVNNWCNMGNARGLTKNAIVFTVALFTYVQLGIYVSYKFPLLVKGIHIFRTDSRSWLVNPEEAFFDLTQPYLLLRQYLIVLHRVVGVAARYLPFQALGEHTMEDRIILLILMWVALVFRIVLFALTLQNIESTNSGEVELAKVASQIRTFMRHKQLPMHLRNKIQLFYSHRFDDRYFEERAILSNLPASFQDAIRRASGRHLISNSYLFRGVPKSLTNKIVSALKEELFLPNDVVYTSGSPSHYLYFLSEGTVAVYLSTGEEVGHLEDGSYFGEMGLMLSEHKQRHVESVVALEVCEVFRLERHDFLRLVRPLPRLFNRIRAAAMLRAAEVQPVGFEYDDQTPRPTFIASSSHNSLATSATTNTATPTASLQSSDEDFHPRSFKSTAKSLFLCRKKKHREATKDMVQEEEENEYQVMGVEEDEDEVVFREKEKKVDARKPKMKRK